MADEFDDFVQLSKPGERVVRAKRVEIGEMPFRRDSIVVGLPGGNAPNNEDVIKQRADELIFGRFLRRFDDTVIVEDIHGEPGNETAMHIVDEVIMVGWLGKEPTGDQPPVDTAGAG